MAHELEVTGTINVLAAVGRARLPRLVVPSLTAVYGARGPAPRPAAARRRRCRAVPSSRFVTDKVQVEGQVRTFRERHPDTRVLVLRFAPILGPTVDNPATRLLKRAVVPTLLGFDPLWQAVHEEDAARALHLALHRGRRPASSTSSARACCRCPGSSTRRARARCRCPGRCTAPRCMRWAWWARWRCPIALLDYIHYSWVADGEQAESALGFIPIHHARDAAAALRRS